MPTVRKWFGHDGLSAGIFFLGGLLAGVFEGGWVYQLLPFPVILGRWLH
jgi:hypothetical protein